MLWRRGGPVSRWPGFFDGQRRRSEETRRGPGALRLAIDRAPPGYRATGRNTLSAHDTLPASSRRLANLFPRVSVVRKLAHSPDQGEFGQLSSHHVKCWNLSVAITLRVMPTIKWINPCTAGGAHNV